jgi:hypothetical protein
MKKAQNVGTLKPIVTAGLVVPKQNGLAAASGSKSQRTAIRHESKHMHPDATKLPER